MIGTWLAHCQSCSLPELVCVFNRAGIGYHVVTGCLRKEAWHSCTSVGRVKCFMKTKAGKIGKVFGQDEEEGSVFIVGAGTPYVCRRSSRLQATSATLADTVSV